METWFSIVILVRMLRSVGFGGGAAGTQPVGSVRAWCSAAGDPSSLELPSRVVLVLGAGFLLLFPVFLNRQSPASLLARLPGSQGFCCFRDGGAVLVLPPSAGSRCGGRS